MKLTRLDVVALPGIQPGFTLDGLGGRVNVVTGPNAAGKSSLVRALGFLVSEPKRSDPSALALGAVFEGSEGTWVVQRTGREVSWELNGSRAERPPLPDPSLLHCYWLSVEDLLDTKGKLDGPLVAELRRALGGGHDLEALRDEPPFKVPPRIGGSERRRLRDAMSELGKAESANLALRADVAKAPMIELDLEAARALAGREGSILTALELVEAHGRTAAAEQLLRRWPSDMRLLRGDEVDRLAALDDRREQVGREEAALRREIEVARVGLERSGLGRGLPARLDLDAHAKRIESSARLRDKLEAELGLALQAAVAEEHAIGELGGEPGVRPRMGPKDVGRAEDLARRLQAAEARRVEVESRVRARCEPPDPALLDAHLRAGELLRQWLSAHEQRRAAAGPLLLVLMGCLVTLVSALLSGSPLGLAGILVCLAGAGWLFASLGPSRRAAARRRFAQTGLDSPAKWERDVVMAHLRQVETGRAALQRRAEEHARGVELRGELSRCEERLRALGREKEALAADLGFEPEMGAAALDRFVRLVEMYEKARLAREASARAAQVAKERIEELMGEVSSSLARWGARGLGHDIESVEAGLIDLRARVEVAESALAAMSSAEHELARLAEERARIDEARVSLYRAAGLEPERLEDLARRIQELEEWRRAVETHRGEAAEEERLRAALSQREDLLAAAEAGDREGLERELAEAREAAERAERLAEEKGAIGARLEGAGKDGGLERAMAGVEEAKAELTDRLEEALLGAAAGLLIDQVKEEYRLEHEPRALRHARERFRAFTRGLFELELDEARGFMARDVSTGSRLGLMELSSATRMQLQLAARIAWIGTVEREGESLPIILDEALTTSDERRFGEVARSLDSLARIEDRQVFYLSAREHDLALWEGALGRAPHHVDLSKVRASIEPASSPSRRSA